MQEVIRKILIYLMLLIPAIGISQQINKDFVDGEIYVQLKPAYLIKTDKKNKEVDISKELVQVNRSINKLDNKIEKAQSPFYKLKSDKLKGVYRIKIENDQDIDEVIKVLKSDPSVSRVEKVALRRIISFPTDTSYTNQWNLKKIKASEAWDVNPGGAIVKVGIVDNAFEINHPDLSANMLPGYDLGDDDTNPSPPNVNFSHGTHVAGIVSAVTNNVRGIAAAANNKVKIVPFKATPNLGSYNSIYYGFEGIIAAADSGVQIISLSWGGPGFSQTEQDVIDYAYQNGVMVIAAAGNEDSDVPQYPASYNHVISVAALDSTDIRSYFSSYGSLVDIAAPGRGILSTIPFNSYASYSGTSMATPLVASCAGYLMSCFPGISIDSVEIILKNTADNIDAQNPDFINQLGAGRINLYKAVACQQSGLFNEKVSISGGNYICQGDTTVLTINAVASETFEWFLNNQSVGTGNDLTVTESGSYVLKRTLGACLLEEEAINIFENKIKTPTPQVSGNLDLFYCSNPEYLVATEADCNVFGPLTYTYSGGTVGFDGYEKSGPFLQIDVQGIGGLIESVEVSISWQKKDGGDETACGIPDGGATPFNEEVFFAFISPQGTQIDLIQEGTYSKGNVSSGVVTTTFKVGAPAIVQSSLPTTGTYSPSGNLDLLQGEIPVGNWTLIASDNATLDPLCVSGFSVKIKTIAPQSPPVFTWYNMANGGLKLVENDSLSVNPNTVGKQNYFVTQRCGGLCESYRIPASVKVKPIPTLLAFPESESILSESQKDEILNALTISHYINAQNLYFVSGINQSNQAFDYQISNQAPSVSPVTLCVDTSYVVFGLGCNGTISWSNGSTGMFVYLEKVVDPVLITATCNQNWNCTPLANIPFEFKSNQTLLSLSGNTEVSGLQNFYGSPIESDQEIAESARIEYLSPTSILLKPGFSTSNQSIFKAETGNCVN